jgi:hypothetical protein
MNIAVNHEPIKICQNLCFKYKSVTLLLTNVHPGITLNMGIRTENRLLSSHTCFFTLKTKQSEIARALDVYNYQNFNCLDHITEEKSVLYYLYVIYS